MAFLWRRLLFLKKSSKLPDAISLLCWKILYRKRKHYEKHMVLLEKISDEELSTVRNLGYFLGSFDPLHQGHIEVVNIVLNEGLCDRIFVYCVRGYSSYKQRSNFFERTSACAVDFEGMENVIMSYMMPTEIQQRLTYQENGLAKLKFDNLTITGIIGSDIAIGLECQSTNSEIEVARKSRQKDFMRGHIVQDDSDSVSCSIALPATDFIVALRNNHEKNDVQGPICGRKVREIIDTKKFRSLSSSKIKENFLQNCNN
jgi:hypothetical protein